MKKPINTPANVTSYSGLHGKLESPPSADDSYYVLTLDNGQIYWIAPDLLVPQADGSYFLPLGEAELELLGHLDRPELRHGEQMVIPVVAEQATVRKQSVITGRVKIRKIISQREEIINEELLKEQVVIEHKPIDKLLTEAVSIRQEGDTLIIPVLEEVLVVDKRLMLKEEIHVTRKRVTVRETQTVDLRKESVDIQHQEVHEIQGDQ